MTRFNEMQREQKKTKTLKSVIDADGEQKSAKQNPLVAVMELWSKRYYQDVLCNFIKARTVTYT